MRSITDLFEQFKKLQDSQSADFEKHSSTIKKLQQDFSDFKTDSKLQTEILKKLQSDSSNHHAEIQFVQRQIENCVMCQGVIEVENCLNSNPCFHGVECRDTDVGMVCGNCPRGHVGDGRSCRKVTICDDQPCFE